MLAARITTSHPDYIGNLVKYVGHVADMTWTQSGKVGFHRLRHSFHIPPPALLRYPETFKMTNGLHILQPTLSTMIAAVT